MKKNKLLLVLSLGMLFTSCAKKSPSKSQNETSSDNSGLVSSLSNTASEDATSLKKELKETTLYLVGDSTVCAFNDDTYYYPRYGYGTQISAYFSEKVNVENYAISGRSTNSFINEDNYKTLKSKIKAGDYLMIGFAHNDEKSGDDRYASAKGATDDEGSFKYNLYNYYIKMAKDVGATPILCTPVARANTSNDYSGESGHIKTVEGNYPQAIIDLGKETNTTVVDLTKQTVELYSKIGYNEAIKYHAWTNNKPASVDKTHLNIYGAKNVAYMFASSIAKSECELKDYVLESISAPTEANDLVANDKFVDKGYEAPNLETLALPYYFSCASDGWFGTAFGDTGGNPSSDSSGYIAREKVKGEFEVGQFLETGTKKGKITTTEGIAMAFRQISLDKNFRISCEVEVTKCGKVNQQGFGLMLRDDIYVKQTVADNTIVSNYVAAGLYTSEGNTFVGYSRENKALVNNGVVSSYLYDTGDKATLFIERIGQVIHTKVIFNGETYENEYVDFDLRAIDNQYMYVGFYGTRGTVAKFTNVSFEITGDAQEA